MILSWNNLVIPYPVQGHHHCCHKEGICSPLQHQPNPVGSKLLRQDLAEIEVPRCNDMEICMEWPDLILPSLFFFSNKLDPNHSSSFSNIFCLLGQDQIGGIGSKGEEERVQIQPSQDRNQGEVPGHEGWEERFKGGTCYLTLGRGRKMLINILKYPRSDPTTINVQSSQEPITWPPRLVSLSHCVQNFAT